MKAIGLTALAILLVSGPAMATCTPEKVHSVERVAVSLGAGGLTIAAEGNTSTAGWTNVALRPNANYMDSPTVDLTLVACPPGSGSMTGQVLEPVTGKFTLSSRHTLPERVIVGAETNSVTWKRGEKPPADVFEYTPPKSGGVK